MIWAVYCTTLRSAYVVKTFESIDAAQCYARKQNDAASTTFNETVYAVVAA
jgi:hypothetical protein